MSVLQKLSCVASPRRAGLRDSALNTWDSINTDEGEDVASEQQLLCLSPKKCPTDNPIIPSDIPGPNWWDRTPNPRVHCQVAKRASFFFFLSMTASKIIIEEPQHKKPRTMSPPVSPTAATSSKTFEHMCLLVQKLSPKGRLPTRGSPFSAGYDIYS